MCFRQAVASAKQIRGERKGRVTRAKSEKENQRKGHSRSLCASFYSLVKRKKQKQKTKNKKKGEKNLVPQATLKWDHTFLISKDTC